MDDKTNNETMEGPKDKISRRDLIKTMAAAGGLAAAGSLVHKLSAKAGGNSPHDKIGDLALLKTSTKDNLVGAVNEHAEQLLDYSADLGERVVNIKHPPAPLVGAKADGITDDTQAIREMIKYAENNNLNIFIPGVAAKAERCTAYGRMNA